MSAVSLHESTFRIEEGLKFGDGTLRERLPASWENGLGCIGRGEIDAISPDPGAEFGALREMLEPVNDDRIGPARAPVAEMTDREAVAIARRIDELCARIEDAVGQGQG